MKRFIPVFSVLLGWALALQAEAPGTITDLRAIHALTNPEASHKIPVAFEATVIYYRGYESMLFVETDGVAIYVHAPMDAKVVPGDRVLVRGRTQDSFRPFVMGDSVTLLHHGETPAPIQTNFEELIRMQRDCLLITLRATVRAADPALGANGPTYLQLLTDKGYIDAVLDNDDAAVRKDLLDAEIEITGVATAKLDGKLQATGVKLYVPSIADVKILKRTSTSPDSLPVTQMDEIYNGYRAHVMTERVRVQGTITYYQPGSMAVLQNGERSLRIMTQGYEPLRIGDMANATGFPDLHDGFLTLTRAAIEDSHIAAPVPSLPATWQLLSSSAHIFDLVSIEGRLVTEVRGASQDEYVVDSDGYLLSAIYHHPSVASHAPLAPMAQIEPGSRVRVTGICLVKDANPFNGPLPFDILLRSFDDIAVIGTPSLLNIRNLMLVVGLLLVILFVAVVKSWTLERKVRRQTAAMAARAEVDVALERRRSCILEDINGSQTLPEILEQITEMVSVGLKGAPSWCELAGGEKIGKLPPENLSLRIIRKEVSSRSGISLAVLFAGIYSQTPVGQCESEALSLGARMAALAIETRRLYTDLRHRSEFDLLTDIHNRFSLDKRLEALIEESRRSMSCFGLIYIDLDRFKQVNDIYGHRVGDLYLRDVAQRMQRQLRSCDLLARLGGDEFAALIPPVRDRAEVEEIAQRLKRCFDDPFAICGHLLHGSASVGAALYPEDGTTKDSLLTAADATMYVAKHCRRDDDVQNEHGDPALLPDRQA